jgi:ribosomal protein L28
MWLYNNKPLKSVPNGAFGFIYTVIRKMDGKLYCGKKQLTHKTRAKISKREKAATKTRKRFKINVKESNWRDYNGSCQELLDDIEKLGEDKFEKHIIQFCANKRELSYAEVKWQFHYNVLETNSYNGNILGRFFKTKAK